MREGAVGEELVGLAFKGTGVPLSLIAVACETLQSFI